MYQFSSLLPYISYRTSWENFLKHQHIVSVDNFRYSQSLYVLDQEGILDARWIRA